VSQLGHQGAALTSRFVLIPLMDWLCEARSTIIQRHIVKLPRPSAGSLFREQNSRLFLFQKQKY